MSTQTLPCAHSGCTDPVECVIEDETGERWGLCEDHAHMNMDGTAEDGYDPNDPEKFSDPPN